MSDSYCAILLFLTIISVITILFSYSSYHEDRHCKELDEKRSVIKGKYKIIDIYTELVTEHLSTDEGIYSSLQEVYYLQCERISDQFRTNAKYFVTPRYDAYNNKHQYYKIGDIVDLTVNYYNTVIIDTNSSKEKVGEVNG